MIKLLAVVLAVLVVGALLVTFKVMGRASAGYDKAKRRRIERGPQPPCSTCGSDMAFAGLQDFKMGDGVLATGPTGPTGTDGSELPFEVFRCPTCRKIELFLPPAAG